MRECAAGKKRASILFAAGIAASLGLWGCGAREPQPRTPAGPPAESHLRVKPGIEVLVESRLDLIRGKRIGLITNPSGVDSRLQSSIEVLRGVPDVQLVALYGPEHGVRGDAQAGETVVFYRDKASNLPVFSLYGPSMKPRPGMLKGIDEFMRSFDTSHEDKKPDASAIGDLDALLFDIQDIGTRIYTYASTMAYAMEACAESGLEFIVLDRPNPITGEMLEGPVLEYPAFSSFVGLYPIPLRSGLTIGELARLDNERFLKTKARLTVVPMEGWKRNQWHDETGLPWVPPSPNIPTLDTAIVYPGQVFLEGTNVSEGRGTTRPFEFFGAPWIDGPALAAQLNAQGLPGVVFRPQGFTPTFSKFQGETCGGCQLHVTDRRTYRPLETTLHLIAALRALYPAEFRFHEKYFDTIMGTAKVRQALEEGQPVAAIVSSWQEGLRSFAETRKPYLLYK